MARASDMHSETPTLHLLCGKIAAGKSTLSARLSQDKATILIVEDDWLNTLHPGEMSSISDYIKRMTNLRKLIGPHVVSLLNAGVSVVLDFQANTVDARQWMRELIDLASANHQLHFLDTPDEVCLSRLRARNAKGDHPFATTEEEFHRVSAYFVPPSPEEGFNIVRHTP